MRIVSLLPSATEILFHLGLADQVVGVTFECDFPAEARTKRIVSTSALPEGLTPAEIDAVVKERMAAGEDLYRLDRGAFAELDPTLVLTQDLCAVCAVDVSEVDDALAHLGCRADVLTLDPMTLDEVLDSVATVGAATQTERAAEIVVEPEPAGRRRGGGRRAPPRRRSCWSGPTRRSPQGTGFRTWCRAGGRPVLARPGANSVGVEWADSRTAAPRSCWSRRAGSASTARRPGASVHAPASCRRRRVWAVDADALVVRPGPRVVEGVELFASILHPDRMGPPEPSGRGLRLRLRTR